ncbi:MAG: hypothetical protein M1819_003891 [Sarea resinae]|nr:MAG: hypothetical protein M1819_003891 [Sarea resinae]
MSMVQPSLPERRASPGLAINLSSNNPFRNRAASPAAYQSLPSPPSDVFGSTSKPASRNPFLDVFGEDDDLKPVQPPSRPPAGDMSLQGPPPYSSHSAFTGNTADLFNNLSIQEKPVQNASIPPQVVPRAGASIGAHRPSGSQEEHRLRNGSLPKPSRPAAPLDIFADPVDHSKSRRERRPRRNSDSSVLSKSSKLIDLDDDRRRRHREREARHRDRKGEGRSHHSQRSKKPNRQLDVIDKLDVTGIYGPGLFHHDGPFDACNPHRNRKKDQRAPMEAFPKGSANNVLGGAGPVNKTIDINQFHGRGAESFMDFSAAREAPVYDPGPQTVLGPDDRAKAFDSKADIEAIHGNESHGLGTSTFLEGAPASRAAIQRRQSETEGSGSQGGLTRKKSLAQRIRGGITQNRSNGGPSGSFSSENRYEYRGSGANSPEVLNTNSDTQSAGGRPRLNERNPFFNDYDDAYERKGASIKIAEGERVGRARAPSSPKGFQRRGTSEHMEVEPRSTGFLSRVKSLKGGRRARPERLD